MATRQENIAAVGFNPYVRGRTSGISGWNAGSISPGVLPTPPGFLTPEQVVEQAKQVTPQTKTFSAADFLTQPAQLSDPKLASRPYSSVLTSTPISAPLSVSAYSNAPVPSFLTNAVNQLNQTQSLQSQQQGELRQQLLDAVLSGNYLAAEALRASVVSPGATVGFGQYVQNPQVGQAAVLDSLTKANVGSAVASNINSGGQSSREQQLQLQLQQKQQELSRVASGSNPLLGQQRSNLTKQQFDIKRELEALRKARASGGGPNINFSL